MKLVNNSRDFKFLFISVATLTAFTLADPSITKKVQAETIETQNSNQTLSLKETKSFISNQTSSKSDTQFENETNKSKDSEQFNKLDNQEKVANRTISNKENEEKEDQKEINISDPNADESAKQLFGYLKSYTHSNKILFGQQQANVNGVTLTPKEEDGSTQSDVKKLTGKNPAVIGYDVGVINGDRKAGLKKIAKSMNAFHDEGGIVVISAHPNNFVTGGDYSDTKGDAVKNILPGGTANAKYNEWLDSIVDLSKELKDKNGKSYAAIYRVFHEQTGAWFWWGNGSTSTEQYIALYRYTVDYFRDHGVHNFLYAYTPGGSLDGNRDRYMKTYPGDNYVDVFGVDNYDTGSITGTKSWLNGVNKDLDNVVNVANEKGKIPSFSEFGIHLNKDIKANKCKDWYTRLFDSIQSDPLAKQIAYMQTWTNFGFPDNVYVPFKGYGDKEIISDFDKFMNDPRVINDSTVHFENYQKNYKELPNIKYSTNVTLFSPTDYDSITDNEVPFDVRVDNNSNADKAIVEINGKTYSLTKVNKLAGIDFITTDKNKVILPDSLNNSRQIAKISILDKNGKEISQQKLQLFIKYNPKPILIKSVPADSNSIKSNGSYPDIGTVNISQSGKYTKIDFNKFDPSASWQEIKLEDNSFSEDDLKKTNQVEISGLVSADSGKLEAYGNDNKGNKTSYSDTLVDIAELPIVNYQGKNYRKFDFVIKYPKNLSQKNLQFGIVGVNADNFDSIILRNIALKKLSKAENTNPTLIDDYSSYLGSDRLLDKAYSTNGDSTLVNLIKNKDNTYSMKYTYTIGANHYAGRGMTFASSRNWQGTKGIQLNLKNDSYPGDDLDLQTNMNGITFEAHIDLGHTHNGQIFVPYTKFAPASWDTKNKGKTINNDLLKDVGTFYFYINSQVEGTRSIQVGNVKAVEKPDEITSSVSNNSSNSEKNSDFNLNDVETPMISSSVKNYENNNVINVDENLQSKLKELTLIHAAFLYNAQGKIILKNGLPIRYEKGETIRAWNNAQQININGKSFYQIAKDGFIKVTNTSANVFKKIKLTHNAFVYNNKGKLVKKNKRNLLIKKRSFIKARNNGKIYVINGKKFYKVGTNEYVKVANTQHSILRKII